jgi:hypothetical protein
MIFLFSLSLLPVATTLYRVPSIIRLQGTYSQAYRTLWASIESLAACVCANAVILNSYARDRGPKKKKFRAPSDGEDAMDRRSVMLGNLYWGSDEDLARDVGMGIDADLLSLAEVHPPFPCIHDCGADVKTEELKVVGVPVAGGV